MVIFAEKNLEKELTPQQLAQERLKRIQHSDAWAQHTALHNQAGMGEARLHMSQEQIFGGEQDSLRQRFGLPEQKREAVASDVLSTKSLYGHKGAEAVNYLGPNDPSKVSWAGCTCGAEFKVEEKGGKSEVKSYGVVGTDAKATGYALGASEGYNKRESFPGYKATSAANY